MKELKAHFWATLLKSVAHSMSSSRYVSDAHGSPSPHLQTPFKQILLVVELHGPKSPQLHLPEIHLLLSPVHWESNWHSVHLPFSWHLWRVDEQEPTVVPSPFSNFPRVLVHEHNPSEQKGNSDVSSHSTATVEPQWHFPFEQLSVVFLQSKFSHGSRIEIYNQEILALDMIKNLKTICIQLKYIELTK